MKDNRRRKPGQAPRRPATDAYNPLTGNRRFFQNLEDGEVPAEEVTVSAPPYEGTGRIFKPKIDREA